MEVRGHQISVCSWSLQPRDTRDLAEKARSLGLDHVQLGLLELVQMDDKRKHLELGHLRAAGIGFTGAMISFPGEDYSSIASIERTGGFIPDEQWTLRRRLTREAARLAQELGVRTITTHVGFVPRKGQAGYPAISDRVREVAADLAGFDVELLMETGQEPAEELLAFLDDIAVPNVHINFDAANMILYGAGDPIHAISVLGKHIKHVHVKDALPSSSPGETWGQEVAFGNGVVETTAFWRALEAVNYAGPLAIEREAGNDRMGDVRHAISVLRRLESSSSPN